MMLGILDRYLIREWSKIFFGTTLGFPIIVILIELTDKLDDYLSRGLEPKTIALAQLYGLPEKIFLVLPAAVLFATVFSIGNMNRHSELTAAKASGRSFHRCVLPVVVAALLAAGAGLAVGELSPDATRRQLELLGELETRSQETRYNFVYRAEEGWVYTVRSLHIGRRRMDDVVLEREGTGAGYPTLAIQARRAIFDDTTERWTFSNGRMRVLANERHERTLRFDSLRLRNVAETPAALLAEPKKPQEMGYAELARYVEALERSGGDGRELRVELALKLAVPFTCFIIAIFGAPLAVAAPRTGGAFGVAVALGTTVIFLIAVQLSRAVGIGGLLPPALAAWLPNILFGLTGVWLASRAPS